MSVSTLKMKELEARSGVGREAIRFYIKEGLLPEPQKPKRNVAHYTDDHVVRLKLIRRLQEERSMPLGQIKNVITEADFSNLSSSSDLAAFELAFISLVNGNAPQRELPIAKVSKKTGFDAKELKQMASLGIITISPNSDDSALSFHDVAVLEKWRKIRDLGFEAERGYDLEFLKRYVDMTRTIAKNEVELFLSAYAQRSPEDGAAKGMKGVEVANDLLGILHTRAVAEEVSRQVDE